MSEDQGRSRLRKRAKRRDNLTGDTTNLQALVERLKQSGKRRRGSRVASESSIDVTLKARLKRVRPASQ